MDKSSNLGMPTHPNKYPIGTSVKAWGSPEAPLLHRQKSGHLSTHYIFIASCTMHFSWSVSCFSFQFSFVLFAAIMVGPQQISFGEVALLFICQEHSVFHSYRSTSVLFF
jgi:hypothetical protein